MATRALAMRAGVLKLSSLPDVYCSLNHPFPVEEFTGQRAHRGRLGQLLPAYLQRDYWPYAGHTRSRSGLFIQRSIRKSSVACLRSRA